MKKLFALLLAIMIVASSIPATVNAESNEYVIAVKDAPIRTGPKEKAGIIAWVEEGTMLPVTGSCYNIHLNKWYEVAYGGQQGYIYSGNVVRHEHDYQTFIVRDITFEVCGCGDYHIYAGTSEKTEEGEVLMANALALLPTSVMMSENAYLIEDALLAAPALSAGDLTLPIGEVIGVCLIIAAVAYAYATPMPEVKDVQDLLSQSEFLEAIREMNRICTAQDFWIVQRYPLGLKIVGPRTACLKMVEAFVASYIFGLDVWTLDEYAAAALASMGNAMNICEKDKDQETYFWHYHYGTDRKKHAHIFFGANEQNHYPE